MARSKNQARQGKQQKKSPKVAAASPKVSSKQGKKTNLTKKQLIQQEKAARKKRDQANRQDVASLFGPLKAGRAAGDSPNRNNGKSKRDSPRGKKSPKKNKRVSNVLVDGAPIHARKRQQHRPHGNNYNSRPKPSHFQLRTIQNPKGCEIPWWTDKDRKQFLASSKRAPQQQAQQHHYLFGKQPPHEQWMAQLDMELTRFAEYVQLSPVEREARQFIVQTIQDLSRSHLDYAKAKDKDAVRVHVFGSFATLPVCAYCSDVDLAIYGLVPPENEDDEDDPPAAVARGKHTRFTTSSSNETDGKLAKVQKWMSLLEQHDKAVAAKEGARVEGEAVAKEEEKKEDGAWQNALDAMLDGANEGPDSPADRKRSDSVVDLTHSPDTPEKDASRQQQQQEDDEDKKPAAKEEPEIIDVDAIPSPPSSPAKKPKQDQFADASPQQDASVAAFQDTMEKNNNDNDDSNKEGSPDTKQPVRMVSVDESVAPPSEKGSQEEQEDSKPAAKQQEQQEQQQQPESDNSQQESDSKVPARHLENETSGPSDNVQEGEEVPKPSPSTEAEKSAEDTTLGDFFVLDRIGIDEEEEEKKWHQKQDAGGDQDKSTVQASTEKDDEAADDAIVEEEERALDAAVGEAGAGGRTTESGRHRKRSYSEATDNDSGGDSEEDTSDKLASFQEQNRSPARPPAEEYRSQQAVISLSSDDEDDDDDEYDNEEEEGDEELDDIQVSFVTDPAAATPNRNAVGPSGAVRAEVVNVLSSLGSILRRRQFTKSVQVIRKARVPIVKFQTKLGFEGDVAMGGHNGTDTSQFAMSQVERFQSFGTVVMALKIMLWQQGLDTPFHGGLGSYKLYVLVAHHLERHLELGGSDRPGEVFLSFLYRYGQVKRGIGVLDDCHRGARSFLTQHALLECCDGCYTADMSATTLLRHCIDLFRRCFMQVGQEHVYTRAPKKGTSILKTLYDIDRLMTERSESREKAAMLNDFQKGQKKDAPNRKQSHRQNSFRGRDEGPSKRRKS